MYKNIFTTYTFWKEVKNKLELERYVSKYGECPECEMFLFKSKGDEKLIKGSGFIEEIYSDFSEEEWSEIPRTLKEALGM